MSKAVNSYHGNFDNNKKYKYYVCCTDKFLSGWGGAENRISKFIIACDNRQQAETIADNLKKEKCFKYININVNKPNYNTRYYHSSFTTFEKCSAYNGSR